ncbi:chloride channel protein [Microvirga sp. P5_D2]
MAIRIPHRVHAWRSLPHWRSRIVFWSGGALVGFIAALFAILADEAQSGFRHVVAASPYWPLLLTPAAFALSITLARRFFPGSQGSGIPQTIAARQLTDDMARQRLVSVRIAIGKVVLTLLGLACGASVGREGPSVQVGASILHAAGQASGRHYQGVILAGSAAGVAAAFNTPLAGIVFAIEEMSRSFEQKTSGLVLTTVIIAGMASLALLGNYTYFGHSSATIGSLKEWLAVPLCGLGGGLMGGVFSRIVVAVAQGKGRFQASAKRYPVLFAASCGLLIALLGLASGNTIYGTGYHEARQLLAGASDVPVSFGLLKMAATILSSISGIPGGIFAPSLAVGAGIGANLSALLPGVPVGTLVLLGMVGYFAGVVQAPITSFVIVMEMTDNHAMAIPLMATALLGYGASRFIGTEAIYHALSQGFLPGHAEAVASPRHKPDGH